VTSRIEAETRRVIVTIEPLNRELLPARPIRVVWPIADDEKNRFDELPVVERTVDFRSEEFRDNPLQLTAVLGQQTREIPVVLSVSGYPRAFRLLQKRSGAGQIMNPDNGTLRLALADAAGKPQKDDKENIVWLEDAAAFTQIERLYAQYEVDVPHDAWHTFEILLFVALPNQDESALPEQALRFEDDRVFHTAIKPDLADKGRFLVETDVHDVCGTFDVKALTDRFIRVKARVRAVPKAGSDARAEPESYKPEPVSRGVYADSTKPIVEVSQQPFKVTVGEPTALFVRAQDMGADPSGLASVLHSAGLDPSGQLKDPEPALSTEDAGVFSIPFTAAKGGESRWHVAAVDRAGNTGLATPLTIWAEMPQPKKEVIRNGTLRIRVVADVRATYLFEVRVTGPKTTSLPTSEDGTCVASDMPPGEYSISATGKLRGLSSVKYKTNEEKVVLKPGESKQVRLTAEAER
jgi:hypothetical protein